MTRKDIVISVVLLLVAAALPIVFPVRYAVMQVAIFFIYATVVVQWNLVLGVAGIFSLAQVGLFALGAYTAAMLGIVGVNFWLGVAAGGAAAVLLAVLIGIACLRLRGAYVALLTLAVAVGMAAWIRTDTSCFIKQGTTCVAFAGGATGLARYGDFGFQKWLGANAYIGNYYVALCLVAAAFVLASMVMRSPYGLAFRALRDNRGYAMARGIDPFSYQVVLFAVSALFTGIAGGVFAANFRAIGPDILSLDLMLFLLSMAVIGGLGTLWGPLLGAAALMVFSEALKEVGEFREIGLGLLIAAAVVFMPNGIAGLLRTLAGRMFSPAVEADDSSRTPPVEPVENNSGPSPSRARF